jgi:hypothetical protein
MLHWPNLPAGEPNEGRQAPRPRLLDGLVVAGGTLVVSWGGRPLRFPQAGACWQVRLACRDHFGG